MPDTDKLIQEWAAEYNKAVLEAMGIEFEREFGPFPVRGEAG
jgi:hypothetical protein